MCGYIPMQIVVISSRMFSINIDVRSSLCMKKNVSNMWLFRAFPTTPRMILFELLGNASLVKL
jgi:hypothetical protein